VISEVYNQDCVEGMKHYPDKFFNLAIVDPPYGIGMGKRKGRCIKGQNKSNFTSEKYHTGEWDTSPPDEAYFRELFRVSQNQIIWGGNYFLLPISRGWLFWDKKPVVPNYSDGELAKLLK